MVNKSYLFLLLAALVTCGTNAMKIAELPSVSDLNKIPVVDNYLFTHKLFILPESVNNRSTHLTLCPLFGTRQIVVFSKVMSEVVSNELFKHYFNNYHFWGLSSIEKNGENGFIIGIPSEQLSPDFNKICDKNTEKKLGLHLSNLTYLGSEEKLNLGKKSPLEGDPKKIFPDLKYFLDRLFVENSAYENKNSIPRWLIIIDGHGTKIQFSTTGESIIKEGEIAGLTMENLAEIITHLMQRITIPQIHFYSCHMGAPNLKQIKDRISSKAPLLTTSGFSAGKEYLKPVVEDNDYKNFLETLCAFKIKNSEFDLYKLDPSKNYTLYSDFLNTYTDAVKHIVTPPLTWEDEYDDEKNDEDDKKKPIKREQFPVFGYNTPSIVFPGKNQPVIPISHCKNIKIIQGGLNNTINPLCPSVILCTGEGIGRVRITKHIKNEEPVFYPYFTRGRAGLFAQTIEELTVPEELITSEEPINTIKQLFPEFCYGTSDPWCLHIKRIKCSGKQPLSLRALFDETTIKVLIYNKSKESFYYYEKPRKHHAKTTEIKDITLKQAKYATFNKCWGKQATPFTNKSLPTKTSNPPSIFGQKEKSISQGSFDNEKIKFITHTLFILPEHDKDTKNLLINLCKERRIFVVSKVMRGVFSNELFKDYRNNYHFWGLPSSNKKGNPGFMLGIPKEQLSPDFNKICDKNTEEKLGLHLSHFTYLGSAKELNLKKKVVKKGDQKKIFPDLKNFLNQLFVENSTYENKNSIPRWLIIINGQGATEFSTTGSIKEGGKIGVLTTENLAKIIKLLMERITLVQIHFDGCHMDALYLRQIKDNLSSKIPLLTTSGFSTGKEKLVSTNNSYNSFLEILYAFSIKKSHLLDSYKLDTYKNFKSYDKFLDTYTKAVEHIVTPHTILDSKTDKNIKRDRFPILGYNTPSILFPDKNQPVISILRYKNIKIIQGGLNDKPNPLCPSVILCTGKSIGRVRITCPIKPIFYPYFTRGRAGLFAQTIEELIIPAELITPEEPLNIIKQLFPEFCYGTCDPWCLHIKSITCSGKEPLALRALFNEKTIKVLIYNKSKGTFNYYEKPREHDAKTTEIKDITLKQAKNATFNKFGGKQATLSTTKSLPIKTSNPPSIVGQNEKIQFITHTLFILPEHKVDDLGTKKILINLGREQRIFVVSKVMRKVISDELFKDCFYNYHFWELPSSNKNYENGFLLGIPKEQLSPKFDPQIGDQNTEKKLGLYLSHFTYLGSAEELNLKKKSPVDGDTKKIYPDLKFFLNRLFVENSAYENKNSIPRWLILIDGHGYATQFSTTGSLKEEGEIGSLTMEKLAKIITLLMEHITLVQMHFYGCHMGALNLRQIKDNLSSEAPLLTTSGFSAGKENIVTVGSKNSYKKFLEILCALRIKNSHLDPSKNYEFYSNFFNTYTKAVEQIFTPAPTWESKAEPRKKIKIKQFPIFGYNTPSILFPGDNQPVIPISHYKNIKIIQGGLNNTLNPVCPSVILCTGKPIGIIRTFKCIKNINDKEPVLYPYFTRGCAGLFAQTIEELTVPAELITPEKPLSIIKKLFPEFCYETCDPWCVHIKNIERSGESPLSLRALFDETTIKVLIYSKSEGTFSYYEKPRQLHTKAIKIDQITLENAKKATFNKAWKK